MFVATVALDIYPAGKHNGERVVVDLGLTDADAMFAYEKSWHKVANAIRPLTPYKFIVRNVQFSNEDRLTLIAMIDEKNRKARERDDFVIREEV